ncbi:hypothetical protein MRB53_032678 [Persea americana]|uniref:Uncharacterized protein n=1 Tax=Persea americana TaxID=3435 RepID=A0ACC2KT43_PERAE|nr:hypothetical protein MRB53_032678 [Persea americana]
MYFCSRTRKPHNMYQAMTLPEATVEIEISEDTELVHFNFNGLGLEINVTEDNCLKISLFFIRKLYLHYFGCYIFT